MRKGDIMNGVEDAKEISSDCSPVSSETHNDSCSTEVSGGENSSPLLDLSQQEVMEELDYEAESELAHHDTVIESPIKDLYPKDDIKSESSEIKSPDHCKNYKKDCSSGDVEEGEEIEDGECDGMEDGEVDTVEHLDKVACRFFQKGRCAWGSDCRFLHLSDKGLYNMFDTPAICKNQPPIAPPPPPVNFIPEPPNYYYPPPVEAPDIRGESVWDRALNEAKERVKLSKMRKEEDTFEENKLYLTVEKGERYVDKYFHSAPRDPGYTYSRKSPVSISKTLTNNFSSRLNYNAQEKRKYQDHDVKKSEGKRDNHFKKANYLSDWHDPWRRSKSPLKRNRARSKSLSDSSRSDVNSQSSWESVKDIRFRSPSPKRSFRRKRSSRSRSISSKHRKLSSRHSRSPSYSKYSSTSSRSLSSASSISSKSFKEERRSRSPSSAFSRRVIYRESEKVRPNKAKSRSISRSPLRSKLNRKVPQAFDKNRAGALVKRQPSFDSVSSSSSSSTSKRSKSRSISRRSDMSISPVSDSPLSEISEDKSSYFNKLKPNTKKGWEQVEKRNHPSITKVGSKSNTLPAAYSVEKIEKKPDPPPLPKKPRKVSALEMELMKYQGRTIHSFSSSSSKGATCTKTITNAKNAITKTNGKNTVTEPGIKDIKQPIMEEKCVLSKRDILMRQLKAVEDAIARKKKTMTH